MDWLPDALIDRLRETIARPDFTGTKYQLMEEIGRGGMGTVYLAHDSQLGRRVALKVIDVLATDEQAAARMAEEARILARLEHPGIVPVHDLGTLPDGRIFYAMKMIEGARLDRYAETKPPLADLLRVFSRVCEAVAFAHSQGVIHRDLKPENIMVGQFGEVLVLDWGVAKITGAARAVPAADSGARKATADGTVVGTRDYMSPEQAAGDIDRVAACSDIYALGATLSTLLASMYKAGVPPKRLAAIARKAASQNPTQRYASVPEMSREIGRFLDGEPVLAYRESVVERMARLAERHKALIVLVAVYLATRILLFLFFRR